MWKWWHDHGALFAAITAAIGLVGAVSAVLLLVRMPADYFVTLRRLPARHPLWHAAGAVLRNALGFALVFLGLVMSLPLVPGPGVLAILLGLSLTSFPGKRKLVIRMLRLPGISFSIDRLRRRFGRPPLLLCAQGRSGTVSSTTKNDSCHI